MIVDPITIAPDKKIADALALMERYRISGVPVTQEGKLVGILTNRDLRFETRFDLPISEVMTKDHLITVPVGTTLEQAEEILHRHRVEKAVGCRRSIQSQRPDHRQGHSEEAEVSRTPPKTSRAACVSARLSERPETFSNALRNWCAAKWTLSPSIRRMPTASA